MILYVSVESIVRLFGLYDETSDALLNSDDGGRRVQLDAEIHIVIAGSRERWLDKNPSVCVLNCNANCETFFVFARMSQMKWKKNKHR